jgi:hypothetical protein
MTDHEKLRRDIDGLKENIRLGWVEIGSRPMTPEEQRELRNHITLLVAELAQLLVRLDEGHAPDQKGLPTV